MEKVTEYPKISIITVCFNSVKTIEQTIDSVVTQTYPNIEYIIIDGGSTDGTVDIIRKYKDRISYWVSEHDRGIYDAMNKGICVATGEYIQFLGSDDCLVANNIIRNVADLLERDSDIDLLSGTVWMVDEELKIQYLWNNEFTYDDVYNGYMIHHQGMFTRTKILKERLFETSYKIVSDYEFFLYAYFNDNIKKEYSKLPIAFYSLSGISASADEEKWGEHEIVMNKYNLNPNYVSLLLKKKKKITYKLKSILKHFLNKCKLERYYLNFDKWQIHTCQNKICRWCCRGKEND